jgi:hypothetical protein
MESLIGAALCSRTIPWNWWLEFETGQVWHYDGMWRAYKPQTKDRIRDEAWNVLSSSVWWRLDRLKWPPTTADCGYCAREGVIAIETANHFA